jgi:transcription antitermination factor NusG
LEERGFEYYMPSEKRLVRDRRHTDLWKIRRFALMVGYVFVRNPHDWVKLADTNGVAGIVRSPAGDALPMSILDMMAIRSIEAEYDAKFDAQSKLARAKLRKKAKTDPRLKKLIGALDMAGTITVPINSEIFESVA